MEQTKQTPKLYNETEQKEEQQRILKEIEEEQKSIDKIKENLKDIPEQDRELTATKYYQNYKKVSLVNAINEFVKTANYNRQFKPYTTTGFKQLDELLNGGIYNGRLYIVGAESGLGKTTFLLQIAENIAREKNPVIFYSLELSKFDLIAKCLSRATFDLDEKKAINTTTIMNGSYTDEQSEHLAKAIGKYENDAVLENLIIDEGRQGTITADYIRDNIKMVKAIKGKTPVIFIDYLQFIALMQDGTGKDYRIIVDNLLKDLESITREFNTPIVLISSINRASNNKSISNNSLKESGTIEFTADMTIGIEYIYTPSTKDYDDIYERKAKERDYNEQENIRQGHNYKSDNLLLKIMKSRYGDSCKKVYLKYIGCYAKFIETISPEEKAKQEESKRNGNEIIQPKNF